jgi:hypothetical protein
MRSTSGHRTPEAQTFCLETVRFDFKWDFEYPFQIGLTGVAGTTTIVGEEEVTVPTGKFKAIKVERLIKAENGKQLAKPEKITVWFASGIGRVKVNHSAGCDLVLKGFTRGR